jgi:hypothetical protein
LGPAAKNVIVGVPAQVGAGPTIGGDVAAPVSSTIVGNPTRCAFAGIAAHKDNATIMARKQQAMAWVAFKTRNRGPSNAGIWRGRVLFGSLSIASGDK